MNSNATSGLLSGMRHYETLKGGKANKLVVNLYGFQMLNGIFEKRAKEEIRYYKLMDRV
jgi:hypothetical protein